MKDFDITDYDPVILPSGGRVYVTKTPGYCFGVSRALELAYANAAGAAAIGEIVHNDETTAELKQRGLRFLEPGEDAADAPETTVIIPSHGAGEELIARLTAAGKRIVDTTCVYVKKIHEIVRDHYARGYNIVIAGDPAHAEVVGISGWCGGTAAVLSSAAEFESFELKVPACIVAQTTFSVSELSKIRKFIDKRQYKTVEFYDTICYTTYDRQVEARFLSAHARTMFVAGSGNSSNTRKLYEICLAENPRTYWIKSPGDLDGIEFFWGITDVLGVVAGASASSNIIQNLIAKLCEKALCPAKYDRNANEEIVEENNSAVSEAAENATETVVETETPAEAAVTETEIVAEAAAVEPVQEAAEAAAEAAVEPVAETAEAIVEVPVEAAVEAVVETVIETVAAVEAPAVQKPAAQPAPKSEFESMLDKSMVQYVKGKRIKDAVVLSADERGISVGIGGKNDGLVTPDEAVFEGEYNPADFKAGDLLDLIITGKDGSTVLLSKKEVDAIKAADKIIDSVRNNEHFQCKVKSIGKGLLGRLGSYRVFIPQSHVSDAFIKDLTQFDGKRLTMKAISIDDEKKEVVASVREAVKEDREKRAAEFFEQIQENMVVKGKVMRSSPFGAFVDINGFDCLAHIGELSWNKVDKVEDILTLGEEYEFLVLRIDKDKRKVSLGYKQLQPHPFDTVLSQFQVGAVVTGTVVRIRPFGAFVEIAKGVDGLVHISEAGHSFVKDINEVLKVGDTVSALITKVDPDTKRVSLSIKQASEAPGGDSEKRFNKFDRVSGDNEQSFRKENKKRPPRSAEESGQGWSEQASNNPLAALLSELKEDEK